MSANRFNAKVFNLMTVLVKKSKSLKQWINCINTVDKHFKYLINEFNFYLKILENSLNKSIESNLIKLLFN